ncbi:MAG: hypothetical protein Kow0098_03300 [Ignavibacteriaceae bacterium]
MDVKVSAHAVRRYVERINPALQTHDESAIRKRDAERIIRSIFGEAKYVSDNDRGAILFRNYDLKLDLIVKGRTIITLFNTKKKQKCGKIYNN